MDHAPHPDSPWRTAFLATAHCLTGCAIGEVLGMLIGTALDLTTMATVVLSVILAFVFGYALTSLPLLRSGMTPRQVVPVALAADSVSITVMEVIDNTVMVALPGVMALGLTDIGFYVALAAALAVAGLVAWPVNRWLIARGRGHAVVHGHHA